MRGILTGLAVLALTAGPAWSASPPAPRRASVITNPDWAAQPSGDEVSRFYPEHAMRNRIGGEAIIACSITVDGDLTSCEVESETPPGEDFGAAAIRMSPYFKMKPKTLNGTPVAGGRVRVPIRFEPPEDDSKILVVGKPEGPPPPLPPTTGRFVFAGAGQSEGEDSGQVFFYLRMPDEAAGGTREAWMLVMFPPVEGVQMHWMIFQTFDCANRTFLLHGVQMLVGEEQVSWSGEVKADWAPVDVDPVTAAGLDLACGNSRPDLTLPDLAAVRSDANKRFGIPAAK